jgi:3'(2'), 5'-bisphosphate nucleotidase
LLYFSNKDKAFKYILKTQTDDFDKLWNDILFHRMLLPLKNKRKHYKVLASKSHQNPETTGFIEKLKTEHQNIEILSVGSSLKFCMIAEGKADIYPRFSNIMEWDVAAGHAIINAAGGKVINTDTGLPLTYNKENLTNPWFIASL